MNTRSSARFAATAAGFGLAALSAAALFGAQGCVVTITDGSDSSTDFDQYVPVDSGKDAPVKNQCNECSYQQCSGQFAACQSQTDCASIYQCSTKPNCDQNCVNSCYASFPNGQAAYLSLASCNKVAGCGVCSGQCNYPSSSCQFPDAGTDSGTVVQNCGDCTTTKCSSEKTACGQGSDCDAYSQCLSICTDIPCVDACGLAHESGRDASNAFGNCTQSKCKSECGL
ncbi:hypothetical protein BH09MYX1_BH09MYX1_12170 [soil metagenome]